MTVRIDVLDEERVSIVSDHDFRDREMIKTLPGARYELNEYRWVAPLTWATCQAMRGIFGDELELGEGIIKWASELREKVIDPAMDLRTKWDAEGSEDLYPFQRAGVQFLATIERGLLLDEMGSGKTIQMIRTLAEIKNRGKNPFPAIIVCPNNMTLTWKKEIEKWWPGTTVEVIKGSAAVRRKIINEQKSQAYIINFEGVRSHTRLASYGSTALKHCSVCDPRLPDTPAYSQAKCERCKKELNYVDWKTVIVDEVHRLKDPRAKQTRACWSLRTDATEFVYGLSGTAIANAPHDLWPALHLVSKDEFPSRVRYIDRYCETSFNMWGPAQVIGLRGDTKPEFFSIVDPRMRRMPKDAVLPFLPKKIFSTRYVEMSAKQAKAYKQMEQGLIAMVGEGNVAVAANPLVQLTRLSQFASAYAEIDDEGNVKLTSPSSKVDALIELLGDMDEEPLVVFAQSRQLIELAAKALDKKKISYSMIVGGQSVDEREKSKEDFQNGRVRVILCTIAAGGIGITLTRASTACFMQRSWSMVENKQAVDRVHRIGSEIHDKVEIIDLVSVDTFEDRQRTVLAGKEDRLEEVMRDKDTIMRILGAS